MESEQGLTAKVPMVNNKEGTNSENPSIGDNAIFPVGKEPDAGRKNALLEKIDQALRYFGPQECSAPEGNVYGENNDKFKKYNAKKRKTQCYICGYCGHEGKRCKKVTDCLICSKKGHLIIDCPNKNVEVDLTSRLCLKCGSTGHDLFSCTNNYDSEDLKGIKCYICRKVGHLFCVEVKTKGQAKASCYKCGQPGHFGPECTKQNEAGPFCNKCKTRGHYKRQCPEKEKAAARTARRKARRARRLKKFEQMAIFNTYEYQPIVRWALPIVGSYYGQPGSNVWLPPAARATSLNNQRGLDLLPSHQQHMDCQNTPQIPQIPPQTGSEISPFNHQAGVVLAQTESEVPIT